jgi:hypothetical protein
MGWKFDNPLNSLLDEADNEKDKALWEKEDLGGITEDNNRVPMPVVLLVYLTVITAFFVTMPLWGQRPTAAIYVDYVKAMDLPEVKSIQDDNAAMAKIVAINKGSKYEAQLGRHPLTMNDLRIIKPQIEALMASNVDLTEYNVVGDQVTEANFEGGKRADGTTIRKQPWWDKGYLIDIFYLLYFFIAVTILIKRLPPSSWQPRHNHH